MHTKFEDGDPAAKTLERICDEPQNVAIGSKNHDEPLSWKVRYFPLGQTLGFLPRRSKASALQWSTCESLGPDPPSSCIAQICRGFPGSQVAPNGLTSCRLAVIVRKRKGHMGQTFCPQCSCDAASVLSFATSNGCFAAAVQCHVCGFETITDEDFQDERAACEAATHAWLEGTMPLPLVRRS
jgi:hypothetical protein